MASKRRARGWSPPKSPDPVEWIGGTVLMPSYVVGEGEPYRPEALFWLSADRGVLGMTVARPGETLVGAAEALRQAMQAPLVGPPHRPAQVRVASSALAEALRKGHPGLEVVCAPTPEVDGLQALMRETMGERLEPEFLFLPPGIEPSALASFFAAAAALFRAAPWKLAPDEQLLFSVTAEAFGLREAVVSVIGQLGESFGLVLFSSLEDYELYADGAELLGLGQAPELPPHRALTFERRAEVSPTAQETISARNLELAGPAAYPSVSVVDVDLLGRPPTATELAAIEAVARSVTHLCAERRALRKALDEGVPISRTLRVDTGMGPTEVTVSAPCAPPPPPALTPAHGLLYELAALTPGVDDPREPARAALEGELLRRFDAAPEGRPLRGEHAARLLMDLTARYLGETIATLDAAGLREVLFGVFPNKVAVPPSEARWAVESTRALYRFLGREFGLPQAETCLRVLGEGAVARLEALLSDSRNFGLAKSFVMGGIEAGFDMRSREGLAAWMATEGGGRAPRDRPRSSKSAPPRPAPAKKGKRTTAKRKARTRRE